MNNQHNTIAESVENLNRMIENKQIMEAFEKYYADDVVMNEVGQDPKVGKEANRNYEQMWVDGLKQITIEIKGVAIDEESGLAFVEAHYDFEHEQWGQLKYDQVAVQRWENGKIVQETFYHADWN